MPGPYLLVIVASFAGVSLLARRFLPGVLSLRLLRPIAAVIGGDPWRVPAICTALSYLQVADGADATMTRRRLLEPQVPDASPSWWNTPSRRSTSSARLEAPTGNAFAIEPVPWQSAYFRQPNRDRTVNGLYDVGAGTHLGGRILGVILGVILGAGVADVTGDVIAADLASGRLSARSKRPAAA